MSSTAGRRGDTARGVVRREGKGFTPRTEGRQRSESQEKSKRNRGSRALVALCIKVDVVDGFVWSARENRHPGETWPEGLARLILIGFKAGETSQSQPC